ncbi:MAG: hypothetical protein WCL14_10720 [Bacteroidota bacterium]
MKRKNFYFLMMILTVPMFFSCGQNTTDSNVKTVSGTPVIAYDTSLRSGVITEKIICKNDQNVSYVLYLPSTYKAGTEYPAIYIFDPHAAGFLPINKYKDLAEKYGYVLIGCNNSKNGMSWDAAHAAIKTMFDDSQSKLSIDKNRIYTAGFSGGSRVASSIAIYDGGIRGVIGCSAGFPQMNKDLKNKFDFIGIAGNEDFNMTEMKKLDKALESSGLRHQLIIFNGKHEWCSKDIFNEAFQWIQVNEMKDKMIPVNNDLVNEIKKSYEKQINERVGIKRNYDALILYKKLISFVDGLKDISVYKRAMDSLANLDDVKKIIIHKEQMEKKEFETQQQYGQEFASKDIIWWTNELNALNTKTKSIDGETSQMYRRILGYLSLVAYSNANNALNQNQMDAAASFIKLYAMIDPPNSEHSYMSAVLFAKQNQIPQAFAALTDAVKLGFDDLDRLNNDPTLVKLKSNKSFDDIVNLIKTSKK